MLLRACVSCLLLALTTAPAAANDGVFGGTGVHPMPMKTSAVRMVDEIVTLRLDPDKHAWNVRCSFIFENTTDEAVTLTIGFPFPTHFDEHMEIAKPRDAKPLRVNEPLVWDFATTVRGAPVRARHGKVEVNPDQPDMEYDVAYLWEVTFAPRERVHIVNTYRHGVSAVVGGMHFANYVLKTGSTWQGGRIGHARLSVEVPSDRYVLCPPEELGSQPAATPAGFVVSPRHGGPGLEVHWSLSDHRPDEDLAVCFMNIDQYAMMHFHTQLADQDLTKLDAEGLRLLRNTVYALRGYTFKDPKLAAHFARHWWYRPDPSFKPDRLTREEREFVAEIRALEKR